MTDTNPEDYDANDLEAAIDEVESDEGYMTVQISRSKIATCLLAILDDCPDAMTVAELRAMLKRLDL